jgi:hypothetical protein
MPLPHEGAVRFWPEARDTEPMDDTVHDDGLGSLILVVNTHQAMMCHLSWCCWRRRSVEQDGGGVGHIVVWEHPSLPVAGLHTVSSTGHKVLVFVAHNEAVRLLHAGFALPPEDQERTTKCHGQVGVEVTPGALVRRRRQRRECCD